MPLPGLEFVLLVALVALACGVAGGYGGGKWAGRTALRECDELGADLVAHDLRIKKLEGRRVREDHNPGGRPPQLKPEEAAQLAGAVQLLKGAAPGAHRQQLEAVGAENDQAILSRVFPKRSGG